MSPLDRIKSRYIVADGEAGWEVWRFEKPNFGGRYVILARGLSENDADAIASAEINAEFARTLN